MKKGVILINTARGGIVNTLDLIDAISLSVPALTDKLVIINIRLNSNLK